ncbi:right-handed parallel beta-helix repeat-containing protein [Methanobrevibacter sp.]|uniref:right-handed parallel beta-helix repeat-containing protein n=1 Tax=Methanobrevibacter sp. TaxID=66852 RepID=UPI0025FFE376|nr:right-handed parallel beta-helix repeat-containing protein [Methanobrevibacter sp.]MBQ2831463.1 right-handed parallel beta-helix repeat-containing protein [Methanobrevibacter sp.]
MNKKGFIIILTVFVLLTLNFSVAHENSADVKSINVINDNQSLKASSPLIETHIDVVGNTTFDVVGDSFKVRLLDSKNKSISNSDLTFAIGKLIYNGTTDGNGVASIPLKLKDGTYRITTKFAGDSKYKSCSMTTTIVMNNTRIVEEGLSNAEIQKIIDSAKANNVILFNGSYYENVNLVINKRLTLLSNSNTILNSSSNKPAISISGKGSSSTTINGFNILAKGNGIEIKNSDYVTIANNRIKTESNGIVALKVNYLNVTSNKIMDNANNGIAIACANKSYITNNNISSSGENGIVLANSNEIYIKGNIIYKNTRNGIYVTDEIDGVRYKETSKNLYIYNNTVNNNYFNGIFIYKAGNNVSIKGNNIRYNSQNGISITEIGDNVIQSNEISNSVVAIKFNDEYLKPENQDISFNVMHHTSHVAVEARDTYYYDYGKQLEIGDNWYTDNMLICPKVSTNNLKFVVSQVGSNLFQATFYDSNGNIASLLPDRTLTYTSNGQTYTMTISGGTGVFTVDANDGDVIKATADSSHRDNTYSGDVKDTAHPSNGVSPTYDYPSIEYDPLYDDVGDGTGDGDGTGQGNGGDSSNGRNGSSNQRHSEHTGNSSSSQNMNPSNGGQNQVNDVSQSLESVSTTSQASASDAGSASDANSGTQSVAKKIIFDEDDIVRVAGISFIVLLMILTIGLYYRDDIKEMKSKL